MIFNYENMSKQKKTKNISIEALKITLKKKQESNAKALAIVEDWIEGVVAEDNLLSNLYYINQEHFQDVIEERAILKNCGYPLCGNTLKDIPSKQFHISTQLNKVFDITERKNFCCNLCYKAARYLKEQLLTSPLWLRSEKDIFHIKLLSLDKTQGSSGIEVDLGHQSPVKPEPEEFTSVLNFTTKSLSKLSAKVDKFEEKQEARNISKENQDPTEQNSTDESRENDLNVDFDTLQNKMNLKILHEETLQISSEDVNKHLENQCNESIYKNNSNGEKLEKINKVEVGDLNTESKLLEEKEEEREIKSDLVTKPVKADKNRKKESSKKGKIMQVIPSMVNVVTHIEQCFREWCTIDTLCYVFGEERVKELLRDKGESFKEYQAINAGAVADPHLYERYLMICRKLNVLELEDSKFDSSINEENRGPQKPLPDFAVLKEEAKNLELKVKSFYKGDKTVSFKEDLNTKEDETPSVLPLVDLHAQKALRRRIVLDRLFRVLSDLGQTLGLKDCFVTQDIRLLVSTFNLSANNVTFKPMEWNLIALVIFKLLSIRNTHLSQMLKTGTSSRNLTLLLLSYQLDGGYLDRLAIWLTDIDYVLRNKP